MTPEEKWTKLKHALSYQWERYYDLWKDNNTYAHGRFDAYDEIRFCIGRLDKGIDVST
jgi:hypothetical protein